MKYFIKKFSLFVLIFFPFFFSSTANAKEIKRELLALWDSSEYTEPSPDPDYTRIHLHLETVLHHLGLKLEYVDISKGLPPKLQDKTFMNRFIGVVTWFEDEIMKHPEEYINWLTTQVTHKKKIMIFGNLGALRKLKINVSAFSPNKSDIFIEENTEKVSMDLINSFFQHLGLTRYDKFLNNAFFMEIVDKNSKYVEFERSLKNELNRFNKIKSFDKKNKVLLKVRQKDEPDSDSDVVVISKNGSYVSDPFFLYTLESDYLTQWRINPFLFVKEALNLDSTPIPDISTINGKRMFYVHIDGDGFSTIYEQDRKSTAAEVFYREIFNRYPYLTTVSVITAEIDPNYYGNKFLTNIAKRIFKLPNVEIGNHTFSHPLIWERGLLASKDVMETYKEFASRNYLGFKIENYSLDYETEIIASTKFINEHLTDGKKKVKIIQWSGNCRPPEEAIKIVTEQNLLNINGGDSRFDVKKPSYSSVAPLYKKLGNQIQVYSTNANENIYTNLWMGPFSGYQDVVETYENTENPIRIRPANAYYHFYSGAKLSSLRAIKNIYRWAEKNDVFSVFTSHYIKVVGGFINTKIEKTKLNEFKLSNFQPLRTFRFENEKKFPDLKKSKNIIGWQHFQDNLYVFLGAKDTATIKLTEKEQTIPYIISSKSHIDSFITREKTVYISMNHLVPSTTVIGNMGSNQFYSVKIRRNNFETDQNPIQNDIEKRTNSNGNLKFKIEELGEFKVTLIPIEGKRNNASIDKLKLNLYGAKIKMK